MRTLEDLINKSVSTKPVGEFDVDISVEIENEIWQAYSACVAHRDILLLTDKGTITYLVDSYGGRHSAELFDWNKE